MNYPDDYRCPAWDYDCNCDACADCCPSEYREYQDTWDAFYRQAEDRVIAGDAIDDVLADEDGMMDTVYDERFHDTYKDEMKARFPVFYDAATANRAAERQRLMGLVA
jgi:hypothetical protein